MDDLASIDRIILVAPWVLQWSRRTWERAVRKWQHTCEKSGWWFKEAESSSVRLSTGQQTLEATYDPKLAEVEVKWSGSLMRVGHSLNWNVHPTFQNANLSKSLEAAQLFLSLFVGKTDIRRWHVTYVEFAADVPFGTLTDLGSHLEPLRDVCPTRHKAHTWGRETVEWCPDAIDRKKTIKVYDKAREIQYRARRERAGSLRREQAEEARRLVEGVLRFELSCKGDFLRQRLGRRGGVIELGEILYPQVPRELLLWALTKKLRFVPGAEVGEGKKRLLLSELLVEARKRWPRGRDQTVMKMFAVHSLLHDEHLSVKEMGKLLKISPATVYRLLTRLREAGVVPEAGPTAMAVLGRIYETLLDEATSGLRCPFHFDGNHRVFHTDGEDQEPEDDQDDEGWTDDEDGIDAMLADLLENGLGNNGDREPAVALKKLFEEELR